MPPLCLGNSLPSAEAPFPVQVPGQEERQQAEIWPHLKPLEPKARPAHFHKIKRSHFACLLLSGPEIQPRQLTLGALPGLLSQTELTSPTRNLGPRPWPRHRWRKFQADKADSMLGVGRGVIHITDNLTSTEAPGPAGVQLTCTTWPAGTGRRRLPGHPNWVTVGRALYLSWLLRKEE